MNTIKRDVYVLRNTIKIPIEVTKGTDAISFEFTVRDYNLPATAVAVAYAYRMGMKKPNSTLCDVSGNVISFQPSANFFEVGNNELQIRVINEDESLISFKEKVKCSDSMGFPDEEEEKQKSLVEQLVSYSGKETAERKEADAQERAERIQAIETEKTERMNADATEKAERQKEIDVERARIDQLTKMGEGSTTGDAELADIRVGNEGATYSNAGNAVRAQTKDVPAMMDNLQSPYVDISLLEQGSLNNTGTEITSSKVLRSVEFRWNKNGKITAPSGYKVAIANYAMQSDESGQMLQVYQSATDYGDSQTSSKADGDTEFRRLLIKRSDGANINAEDLRGKITTNVPGLRAMDAIENLEKKIKTDTTLEKEGVAADAAETGKRVSQAEEDIGSLNENLGELAIFTKQYLDKETAEQYHLWNGREIKERDDSWSRYRAYDAIKKPKGTYTILDEIYAKQSYIKGSNNVFKKVSDIVGSDNYYIGDITLDEESTLYISTDFRKAEYARIIKKTNLPINVSTIPYEKSPAILDFAAVIGAKNLGDTAQKYVEDCAKKQVSTVEAEYIDSKVFQYLGESYADSLWKADGGLITNEYTVGYTAYHPIDLIAGKYTFLDDVYAEYSFMKKSDGTVTKFKDYLGISTIIYNGGELIFDENVTLYICSKKNTLCRIINKSENAISVPYKKGLVSALLNKAVKASGIDFSIFDQAFIKNGELTCNNDHVNSANTVAKYIRTDMESDVVKVMCKAIWRSSQAVALISTKLDTDNHVRNITKGSIHIVFTPTKVNVGMFEGGTLRLIGNPSYSTQPNVEYEMGYSISGNSITVYMPDGTEQTFTDDNISSLNGKYVIYEHYMGNVSSTSKPTDEYSHPVFTGFYTECVSGHPLRDNFKRNDGHIGVAPSGHVYTLFRNTSNDDTRYDVSDGQVK